MRWKIRPACDVLKLPRIHWHALRHTYNTWGRLAGIEAEVMRDQMGHSDVRITLQTYSHVRPTDDAAGRIEALLTVRENGTPESQVVH
jgi:integrase